MTESLRRVRIALVDSGVEPSHPGVRGRAVLRGDAAALRDELGHGTWMAAAILAQCQDLELGVVRVLDELDHCEPERLLRGIDDALEFAPDLVNVSLGVTGLAWRAAFAELVARASSRGARLVAPAALAGMPCWPGALDGVESVVADPNVPRVLPVQRVVEGRRVWFASPTAPALGALPAPRARGESLATANVTGFLASLRTR
jgi:hypothetical protein